jgi:cystathionine beta-lyase
MRYDFDRLIDRRNTDCVKHDRNAALFGTKDVLAMWVADMDFPCPEPVLEAMRRRLDHPILGYTYPPEPLYRAIIDRMDRAYGWAVQKDWIVFVPGVVDGVYAAVRAMTQPGDEVVVQPPVYFPFFPAVTDTGCQLVHNPLRREGDGYVMDLDDLARRFATVPGFPGKTHRIRALVLCSPHNPVGRVWTADELRRLGDLCLANDCVIVSDEIHCDLLVGKARHTPTASLSPALAKATITLMAPSKSFNLAGLGASFAIIPDPGLRRRFARARAGQGGVNLLGFVAMEAALRDGDDYLAQLNAYLAGNVAVFARGLAGIPGLRLVPPEGPEGTYLAWVDMRGLGLDDEALKDFMLKKARIATSYGAMFGAGGEGFQRFNLACPRSVVEEAVSRLGAAVAAVAPFGPRRGLG